MTQKGETSYLKSLLASLWSTAEVYADFHGCLTAVFLVKIVKPRALLCCAHLHELSSEHACTLTETCLCPFRLLYMLCYVLPL